MSPGGEEGDDEVKLDQPRLVKNLKMARVILEQKYSIVLKQNKEIFLSRSRSRSHSDMFELIKLTKLPR